MKSFYFTILLVIIFLLQCMSPKEEKGQMPYALIDVALKVRKDFSKNSVQIDSSDLKRFLSLKFIDSMILSENFIELSYNPYISDTLNFDKTFALHNTKFDLQKLILDNKYSLKVSWEKFRLPFWGEAVLEQRSRIFNNQSYLGKKGFAEAVVKVRNTSVISFFYFLE